MADPTVDVLNQRLDTLQGQYALRFANRPRISRDLATMEAMIDSAKKIYEEARASSAKGAADVVSRAKERLDLYRSERDNIAESKKAGPEAEEASELGTRANFVFGRYRRHFAGKNRRTRDLGLLAEMVEDLEAIKKRMGELKGKIGNSQGLEDNLQVVTRQLDMYKSERGEIVAARGMGGNGQIGNIGEEAELLGTLANDQFALYRAHFAGRARTTRRPELLQRILDNLGQILDRMKTLTYINDATKQNISIVTDQVKMYREELEKIKTAQRLVNLEEFVDSLRYEVNSIIDEYNQHFAGQNRADRDLDQLTVMCDRLGDLEKVYVKLDGIYDDPKIKNNLGLTRDALAMFDREWLAIQEAKRS